MYLNNKYTSWYFSIISKAKQRSNLNGYTEKHHIIPKSLGGSNDTYNLVTLTAREHFICHLLLPKMVEGKDRKKMIYASWAMVNQKRSDQDRYKVSSKIYNIIKESASSNHKSFKHTEEHKKKIAEILRGRKLSEETRQKLSNAAKKRPVDHYLKGAETRRKNNYVASEETCLKISKALTGRKRILTEEHKKNIAIAARNRSKKLVK